MEYYGQLFKHSNSQKHVFGPIGASFFESIFTIFTITEDRDKLLLIQSIDDSWSFPRGRVQKNETIMEASSRIVLEYTGISTKPNGIVQILHSSKAMFRKSISKIDFIFQSELTKKPSQDINSKSVKSIRWVNIQDIENLKLMEEDLASLAKFKDCRSKNNICSINLLDSKVL